MHWSICQPFIHFYCVVCVLMCKFASIFIFFAWKHHFKHISSPSAFQASRCVCASTPGRAAAPVRWRTATWQLFAARRSRRCDPTALNWSTWLLATPRPIKVRDRRWQQVIAGGFSTLFHTSHTCFTLPHVLIWLLTLQCPQPKCPVYLLQQSLLI